MNSSHVPSTANTGTKITSSSSNVTSPTLIANSTPTRAKTISDNGDGTAVVTLVASPRVDEGANVLLPVNTVKGFEADETLASSFTDTVEETKAIQLSGTDTQIGDEVVPSIVGTNEHTELITSANACDSTHKHPNESCPPSKTTCDSNLNSADTPESTTHKELEGSLVNDINPVVTLNHETASGREEFTCGDTPETRDDDSQDNLVRTFIPSV